jgi:hypothetical protein
MDKDIFKKIILDSVIQVISSEIAERVRKKMILEKNRLLVVFSGGAFGFSEAIKSLRYLEDQGYDISYILTESGARIFGEENIKTLLKTDKVYLEGRDNIDKQVNNSNILILPTLTANSVGKIANCINDTSLTRATSQYILERKTIFAATNCCCPEDGERLKYLSHPINEFYKKQMTENMEKIEKFGVKFTYSKNIGKKVSNHIKDKSISGRKAGYIEKILITRTDIAGYPDNIVLYTDKDCRFTDMAMEMIKNKNIRIEYK